MPRIQYKQIERLAAKYGVGISRTTYPCEDRDYPAVCLTGFLSEIEKVVWAAQDIAGDSPYYVYPNNGGTGVYLIR
jgi:hypothetical protein